MKHIVVFTGAGISADSGLKTFRGEDGLWEGYHVEDVATPEAWRRDPSLVQEFYNLRRKSVREAEPNAAHRALAELEAHYRVSIITQNIDDLHERAGSSSVLHLHGIITKAQSSLNPRLVYPVQGTEIRMGEKCELGSQLRPHVVWFGEAVPNMEKAARLCGQADTFLVIGTSLQVYPAAGLIHYVPAGVTIYIVDPQASALTADPAAICLNERAAEGVPRLVEQLVRSGG